MTLVAGIDIAKEFHWAAIVVAETGRELVSRRVDNAPDAIGEFIAELAQAAAEHGPATVGIDVLGGIAGLVTAMLLDTEHRLVHVPGLTVNRSRHGTRGGEHKSDPRDARVIADQLRLREDWRPVTGDDELTLDLRLLVSRRSDLVTEQTRRINRTRDMLTGIFPGLERALDLTNLGDLRLLTRYTTPAEIRRAGRARITAYLHRNGVRSDRADRLAAAALEAAGHQRVRVPGETRTAQFVRELANDALTTRARLSAVDSEIAEVLDQHPDAALVRSLPGMGATLTAEFLAEAGDLARFAGADALAAASGLAPVLQQSGKMHYLRRATGGGKNLKRVFYHSAFCAIQADPASKAFYARKRAEGKRHQQALIALARRRVTVLYAILRTRQPYQANHTTVTPAA
ncbi:MULTISPECIES: IS110 family transposase [Pseudonocardiaceae]|uniref:Transposase IS116/IS110/IS902 family protein n=2 Tax=Pseudonocardiaceae TaxID=2070 RepID=A0A2N3X0N9_9PSEU|nr:MULTISPECIES: IS110 family transposase [Amycolatopsis]PKV93931.1 transposase IS116/IS110/IS902 family protein [Amycolatopsis niigatensis]PKV95643.1 transposase IS116/IS110/IS902 family protein [Amycolatopsis niigatensis]PKV99680.1 transposase IS116/IS110/IS902 family protein [Amycolatopsis niigatensis]